jgi:hypothetical protein
VGDSETFEHLRSHAPSVTGLVKYITAFGVVRSALEYEHAFEDVDVVHASSATFEVPIDGPPLHKTNNAVLTNKSSCESTSTPTSVTFVEDLSGSSTSDAPNLSEPTILHESDTKSTPSILTLKDPKAVVEVHVKYNKRSSIMQ